MLANPLLSRRSFARVLLALASATALSACSDEPKPSAVASEPLTVFIGPAEPIMIGDKQVSLDQLGPTLRHATGGDFDQRIMVKVRGRVDGAFAQRVIQAIQDAGFLRLALVAKEVAQ